MEKSIVFLITFALSFVLTACTVCLLIPVLKRLKVGQRILEIGPEWHKNKEGTPTMGGLAFLFSVTLVSIAAALWLGEDAVVTALVLTYALLCGLIGVVDDLKKLRMKRNEGLTALQKLALQLVFSALFTVLLRRFGVTDTSVYVPFYGGYFDLGPWYYLFSILFLTGFGNAVNLTDGLDGLCSGVTATAAVSIAALALKNESVYASVISFALVGACVGFLVFNIHPARVFMGDTGSLFLGGAVSGLVLALGDPLILFFVGAVYVIEAASVVIQVLYFKLTGKRLFLMAPIHHHFEKKGMSENTINALFIAITAAFGGVCYFVW